MIYPPSKKPPIWSIDPGIVAYNCNKHGFPHPIVAMPMWEMTGHRTLDYSGHMNHGELNQGALWIKDNVYFDGADDHIESTDIDGSIPFPQITISIRVHLIAKTGYDTICEKNDGIGVNTNKSFRLFLDDTGTKWRWKVWGADGVSAGNVDSDAAAVTGEFVDVLVCYDGSEVAMWINNVKQAITQAETGNLFSAANNFRIGAGNNAYLNGAVESLTIFNKSLDQRQKTLLHENPYFLYQIPEELYGYVAAGWTGVINGITNPTHIINIPVVDISEVIGI